MYMNLINSLQSSIKNLMSENEVLKKEKNELENDIDDMMSQSDFFLKKKIKKKIIKKLHNLIPTKRWNDGVLKHLDFCTTISCKMCHITIYQIQFTLHSMLTCFHFMSLTTQMLSTISLGTGWKTCLEEIKVG